MSQEIRKLTPEELAKFYPKMLYRMDPQPRYIEAEDPEHEAKLIKQGWKKADELTPSQVNRCTDGDDYPASVSQATGGQVNRTVLQNAGIDELKTELVEMLTAQEQRFEARIADLEAQLQASKSSAPAEPQNEGPVDQDPPPPNSDDQGQGNQNQEPPQDRYSEIAPIFGNFLKEDPDKQSKELWTKDGLPNANVLSEQLGSEVTAEERDNLWYRFEQARTRVTR